jgi:hypothetical protein
MGIRQVKKGHKVCDSYQDSAVFLSKIEVLSCGYFGQHSYCFYEGVDFQKLMTLTFWKSPSSAY